MVMLVSENARALVNHTIASVAARATPRAMAMPFVTVSQRSLVSRPRR